MADITHEKKPKPVLLLCALVSPFIIFGLAVLLAGQFRDRPNHGYSVVSSILLGQLLAVLTAVICVICGWKRGERPLWLGIVGVVIGLYILKRLLFAS